MSNVFGDANPWPLLSPRYYFSGATITRHGVLELYGHIQMPIHSIAVNVNGSLIAADASLRLASRRSAEVKSVPQ